MTIEAWSIFIYGMLGFIVIFSQAMYASLTAGATYGFTNRDKPQPNKGALGNRIDNTLHNLKEGALMYLPFALLAVHFDISNSWTYYAALATIVSRVCYVPIYILGIQKVRTFVWTPSFFAVPAMAYGVYCGIGA
jgi:uncharacterized MAPEG superfamily protein